MGSSQLFRPLDADDPEPETTTIESLCMNCRDNVLKYTSYDYLLIFSSIVSNVTNFQGVTRMLLTKIPFYKDVIIISFECKHCGYKNNEIQSGGRVEEKGIRINFNVKTMDDLNRILVKSDFTSIRIPEIEFEIPANSQKGGQYQMK